MPKVSSQVADEVLPCSGDDLTDVARYIIRDAAQIISSSSDEDQAYERFADELSKLIEFDRVAVNIIDEARDSLRIAWLSKQTGSSLLHRMTIPLDSTASSYVARTRKVLILEDMAELPQFWTYIRLLEEGLRSGMFVPLISEGRVWGTLSLFSRSTHAYGTKQRVILERLGCQIATAVGDPLPFRQTWGFALALESVSNAVVFTDCLGNIQFANHAWEDMSGYTSAELLGQPLAGFAPPAPDSQARARHIFDEAIQGGWRGVVRLLRKNAEEFDVNFTATPVSDQTGSVISIVGVAQDIAEWGRMAQLRAEIERRYRGLTETAMCALIINEENRIWFIDRAGENIFGHTVTDMLGQEMTMLVPGLSGHGLRTSLRQDHDGDGGIVGWASVELPGLCKSGKEIALEISFGEFIKNGKPFTAGIVRNVSDRKKSEGIQRRMVAILEGTPDFIGMADVEGHVHYINDAGRKMVGVGVDEDISRTMIHDYHPRWALKMIMAEGIPTALRDGMWSGEGAFLSRDVREIPASMVIIAHRATYGRVEYLSTISRDISLRKQAEDELRESENRFRRLAANVDDLIYRIRMVPTPIFEYLSPAVTLMTGYAPEDYYADPNLVVRNVHPDDRVELEKFMRGEDVFGRSIPLRWVHKDGRTIWTEQRNVPVYDESGNLIAIEGIARDITDRRRAEAAVLESELKAKEVEALQRIDGLRKDLIATVSHELRNPLASIKGYISTLLQPDVTWGPELQREFLEVADQEADRLNRLVGDLLIMSQLEAGVMKLDREQTWMADLAGDLHAHVGPLATGHELTIVFGDDLPAVSIDQHRIVQVISNLVSNASKFSDPGTHIAISADRFEDQVVVRVSDEGKGIPGDLLQRVFEPFYRVDDSAVPTSPGSGLGLSICLKMVEAHGGEIWVESEPGKGTSVYFSLPTAR